MHVSHPISQTNKGVALGFDLEFLTIRRINPMKNLLIEIVTALVDNPEQVQVAEIEGSQTTILELKVAKSDMGKVIGKHGKTANAIRAILNAASGKTRKKFTLEIVE